MNGGADEMVARYTVGDTEYLFGGDKIQPDEDDWRALTALARDKVMTVEVYARHNDQWMRYKPF